MKITAKQLIKFSENDMLMKSAFALPVRQLRQFNNKLIPDSEPLTGKTLA